MYNLKYFLLTLLYFLLAYTGKGQTVAIKILDNTNLQAIADVVVVLNNNVLQTNQFGIVVLTGKSSDSLIISHYGYNTKTVSFDEISISKVVYLNEKNNTLDEVVVSASKFEELRKDVPQQIYTLNAKQIALANQATTADLLQQSGQVLVQKSQAGGGSPIIRGFEANKVLIVVDGVRMNNAIYRGGHLQNIITLDPSALERTEIVFGAGSVVYGSDALGGVMHFHTRKPVFDKKSANLLLRHSTANKEATSNVGWNIGGKNIAWVGNISRGVFDDLRMGNNRNDDYGNWGRRFVYANRIDGKDIEVLNGNTNLQKYSGYSQIDILQKLSIKLTDSITNTLNVQYSTSSNIPRYDRLSELNSSGKLIFADWYYGPQTRFLASYQLSFDKPNTFYTQARVILAFQSIEESRYDRRFNSALLNNRIESVEVLTLNVDFNKNINKHEMRYGFELTRNNVWSNAFSKNINSNEILNISTRYPDGGSIMNSIAGYFTHSWEIGELFVATQGLRYTYTNLKATFEDKTFFPFPFNHATQGAGALNGNVSFIAMPKNGWRFVLNGSSGFRVANIDDLAKVFESTTQPNALPTLIVPNADLKPEYTYTAELNISKRFFKTFTVEAIGYWTWYRNAISSQPFTLNGQSQILYNNILSTVIANQNNTNAYIKGLYFNISADFGAHISLNSSLTYTYGRVKDAIQGDLPLDHIAPIFGRTGLRLKTKQFQGELFALYNGSKPLSAYSTISTEDNLKYAIATLGTPAWLTLNARIAYQANRVFQVQVAVENILDRHYRIFASGISAAGRNLVLSLRANF